MRSRAYGGVIGVLVAFNAVPLIIYGTRDEVKVMRLAGRRIGFVSALTVHSLT